MVCCDAYTVIVTTAKVLNRCAAVNWTDRCENNVEPQPIILIEIINSHFRWRIIIYLLFVFSLYALLPPPASFIVIRAAIIQYVILTLSDSILFNQIGRNWPRGRERTDSSGPIGCLYWQMCDDIGSRRWFACISLTMCWLEETGTNVCVPMSPSSYRLYWGQFNNFPILFLFFSCSVYLSRPKIESWFEFE